MFLEPYFYKFIVSDKEIRDECCLKYLTRVSGRHCHNCPEHPMRVNTRLIDTNLLNRARLYIAAQQYVKFIQLLDENNLPVPHILEMTKKLSEKQNL